LIHHDRFDFMGVKPLRCLISNANHLPIILKRDPEKITIKIDQWSFISERQVMLDFNAGFKQPIS